MRTVLVGLVTHGRSRFNVDGAATAQANGLVVALARQGVAAELLVSDRDDYDPATLPLDRPALLSSARHQARLELRWRRYLARAGGRPARAPAVDWAAAAAMTLKRLWRTGALWGAGAAGRRAATRLLNIDLSHLRVLQAGVDAGADWILVLEDDARVADVQVAADQVRAAIDVVDRTAVAFVCMSQSIAADRLGIDGLLGDPVAADGPPWLVRATTPITNTVCANLYRASFARDLVAGIRSRGLVPVAPIDWRLNEQVLSMVAEGRLDAGSCAWTLPGTFRQGSMHDA